MPYVTLTRAQSRRIDQLAIDHYGLSGLVLMENAGRGVTDVLVSRGIAGPVAICCGKGNNAGDGFVIARHLDLRGFEPRVLLWAEPAELTGDAAALYVLGWFNFGEMWATTLTEERQGQATVTTEEGGDFWWGLNIGVGIRAHVTKALSVGTEWGWGIVKGSSGESDREDSALGHGIWGTLTLSASIPL